MNSHPGEAITILRKFIAHKKRACPHCACLGIPHKHSTDKRSIIIYKCYHCNKTFSELFGTIFHRSKIPLAKWLIAIIEWQESTGSISASELSRKINISSPSAWSMLMKIRKLLHDFLDNTSLLSEIVEADEAWFGKKDNQDIVLGLVQRNRRKLRLIQIPNVKEETLYPYILNNVSKGSLLCTDQRITYSITSIHYNHKTTNHSKGEFARNHIIHSNTIEQIWGDIKGIIRTIHHGVSKKYRHLYFAQYIFKYENLKYFNFFNLILCQLFFPRYCLN